MHYHINEIDAVRLFEEAMRGKYVKFAEHIKHSINLSYYTPHGVAFQPPATAVRNGRAMIARGRQRMKFASNCSPILSLFSGWNCTAKILSCAMAQVNGRG